MRSRWKVEDSALLERATTEYYRELKKRRGVLALFEIADELRKQVLLLRPDWPSSAEREEDLAMHLRVREALARVPTRRR